MNTFARLRMKQTTDGTEHLMTKAMVVQNGAVTFAFVGNDLCSVPRDLTGLARLRASKVTGIPVANIVITATHTHGGPEYLGPLRDCSMNSNPETHHHSAAVWWHGCSIPT